MFQTILAPNRLYFAWSSPGVRSSNCCDPLRYDQVPDRSIEPLPTGDPRHCRRARGLAEFIAFVRKHKELYRIIDESEFVDPESFRLHYATTADRIRQRLQAAAAKGDLRGDVGEVHAWAVMGMNVFLGLRYGVWDEDVPGDAVADQVAEMFRRGIGAP